MIHSGAKCGLWAIPPSQRPLTERPAVKGVVTLILILSTQPTRDGESRTRHRAGVRERGSGYCHIPRPVGEAGWREGRGGAGTLGGVLACVRKESGPVTREETSNAGEELSLIHI